MRIFFEIGSYSKAREILTILRDIVEYYELDEYKNTVTCWLARSYFYEGFYKQGFSALENVRDSEEKLYFLSEACLFYDEKEKALRYAMLALKLALHNASRRFHTYNFYKVENVFSLHEGLAKSSRGKRDPILQLIQAFAAYLHTLYGNINTARKILKRVNERPSTEFHPFQYIFHFFLYKLQNKEYTNDLAEAKLYLSYAISTLQNNALKIIDSQVRHSYIYNNYWNKLLVAEGEQHNLFVLGSGPTIMQRSPKGNDS